MPDRLFVAVLGHRNSGKSRTWNDLFALGRSVKTGSQSRSLELAPNECVEVFLVSGSNEERNQYAGDVLNNQNAGIVLCSVQYIYKCRDTFDYAKEKGFELFVQWLNPGYHDQHVYFDYLGRVNILLDDGATLAMRNGKVATTARVREIREFIYGWAKYRNLVYPLHWRIKIQRSKLSYFGLPTFSSTSLNPSSLISTRCSRAERSI